MANEQTRTPKRFGQTAAAQVDLSDTPLSDLAGQELRIYAVKRCESTYGPYLRIRVQCHGEASREVTTSSETVMRQLAALADEDLPMDAWLHQGPANNGTRGRLWFAEEAPERPEGDLSRAKVSKRGS